MKHRQKQGRILLPGEAFEAPQDDNEIPGAALYAPGVLQANTTETISLQIDKDLLNEIRTLSAAVKEIQEIRKKKASGTTRDWKIALGLCEENNGLLMYNGLIWIPDNNTLRLRILRDHHDAQAVGHPGQTRTLELVSRNFYWPGQRKYVHRYVDHCDTCHRIKPIRHAPCRLLKPLELPHRPWDTISTDFITSLPTSIRKNALWVIIDRLTKMGHFVACQDTMNPEDLADHFLRQVIRPHRLPSSIVSGRGSLFTSNFWKRVTEALGISRNLSAAFHPQTDGQTERANATLEQYLRAYCNYQQDDWETLLPIDKFCYNNTQTGTTRITAFFANYGNHPRFLPDLGTQNDEPPEVSEYVEALRRLHEELRAEIKEAQMSQAEQAKPTKDWDLAAQAMTMDGWNVPTAPSPPLSAVGQPRANDHVSLHWTACYDDYCGAHHQMKDDNYYPQRGNDRCRCNHRPCSFPHAHPFELAEVICNRHHNPRKVCADWQKGKRVCPDCRFLVNMENHHLRCSASAPRNPLAYITAPQEDKENIAPPGEVAANDEACAATPAALHDEQISFLHNMVTMLQHTTTRDARRNHVVH